MKLLIDKITDWILLLLCITGLGATFFCPVQDIDRICKVLGTVGALYCGWYLIQFLFCPIRRDQTLVRGGIFRKVMNFVLFVPFIITAGILFYSDFSEKEYYPINLAYDSSLFNIEEQTSDPASRQPGGELDHRDRFDGDSVEKESPSLFWIVFYHFIDPGNQQMAVSGSGRRLTALTTMLGIILMNGLLISTLISLFDRQKERWNDGEIRYGPLAFAWKKFAIVIGSNETAPAIVKHLTEGKGERKVSYVVLLTNEPADKVREQISSYLTDSEADKLIIYSGQLDSIEEIYRLRAKDAGEIYILGESISEDVSRSYHDTQNMKCVHNIASYLEDKGAKHKSICRVQFEYQTTFSVFQFSDLPDNIRKHIIFIPFNTYENWAQQVFVRGRYDETTKMIRHRCETGRTIIYKPLDGSGIMTDSTEHVHLVITGMSKMGIATAIQAAQLAHFPNFRPGPAGKVPRTRITFIDPCADTEMDFFKGRYQNLFDLSINRYIDASEGKGYNDIAWNDPVACKESPYAYLGENFIDIEWEFIKGDMACPAVRGYMETIAKSAAPETAGSRTILTVAVCLPLSHEAIATAIYMPDSVYDYASQILVYQREASDIVYNLYFEEDGGQKYKRYYKLRPFGMQYADFTVDRESYLSAQLCNYVYKLLYSEEVDAIKDIAGKSREIRRKLSGLGDELDEKPVKKVLEVPRGYWKELSIFDKWSNKYLANSFRTKLRSTGYAGTDFTGDYGVIKEKFTAADMAMAECEHNRWNIQQLLMGFRAYTEAEGKQFMNLENDAAKEAFKKKMKKGQEKAHLNICPFDYLGKADAKAKDYDWIFDEAIPEILGIVAKADGANDRTITKLFHTIWKHINQNRSTCPMWN